MDGYAVRARDTRGATPDEPMTLDVIGEVAAGYQFAGEVDAGTAVRIMTGAPVPRGADSIVPFEETDEPFDKAPAGSTRACGERKGIRKRRGRARTSGGRERTCARDSSSCGKGQCCGRPRSA